MNTKISAAESIVGVMAKVGGVAKKDHNEFQNFNFRGIDAVMNAVGPALREVGGFIKPDVLRRRYEHGISTQGKPTIEVRLLVRYSWYGTDGGNPITAEIAAESVDTSDKGTAKAMSVAFRTYLLQILCLPTDEPDPDADYTERGEAAQAKKPARRAPAPKAPVQPPIEGRTVATKDWGAIADAVDSYDDLREVFAAANAAGDLNLPTAEGGALVGTLLLQRKSELVK